MIILHLIQEKNQKKEVRQVNNRNKYRLNTLSNHKGMVVTDKEG